jgi:hypothetical protein
MAIPAVTKTIPYLVSQCHFTDNEDFLTALKPMVDAIGTLESIYTTIVRTAQNALHTSLYI